MNDLDKQIIDLYMSGLSIRAIAIELNVNRRRISKLLKSQDIHIKKSDETSRKFNFNENYFESIDTPEKAYWLGFIYADGGIRSKQKHGNQALSIMLSSIDKEHLYKLNKCLNSTYEVKDYIGSGYNEDGEFSKLVLTSQKLVDDLKKWGVVERKTKILKFPDFLDKNLLSHFIRGYMDGDGSITSSGKEYYLKFTGTKEFLEGINQYFEKNNKIQPSKSVYELEYGGNRQVERMLNLLYDNDNATIFLDRKHDKYLEFKIYRNVG